MERRHADPPPPPPHPRGQAASRFPWADTLADARPEAAHWRDPQGAASDDRPGFDAETWSARLIDLLETRVITRLDDLNRRVAELEAELGTQR